MRYVTYDPATGALTGAYLQDLLPDHAANHIEVSEADYANWVSLQANAARTGVEPAPGPSDADLLAKAKAAKDDEINAARLDANQTSFPYGGKQIACDPLSRSDIDGTNGFVLNYGTLPPGWPGAWKATDNTYVTIPDVATWKLLYAAMVGQGLTNFSHAQALKTALADATTLAQVAAINW